MICGFLVSLAICGMLPLPLLAQDPTPCVDGVFAGDVGDYQGTLDAAQSQGRFERDPQRHHQQQ